MQVDVESIWERLGPNASLPLSGKAFGLSAGVAPLLAAPAWTGLMFCGRRAMRTSADTIVVAYTARYRRSRDECHSRLRSQGHTRQT